MDIPILKAISSSQKTQIRGSRSLFSNFIIHREQLNSRRRVSMAKLSGGGVVAKNIGAVFTTKEEKDRILNLPSTATSAPTPVPTGDCPVNFNALNLKYRELAGLTVDFVKLITINGFMVTVETYNIQTSNYDTYTFPLFEVNTLYPSLY